MPNDEHDDIPGAGDAAVTFINVIEIPLSRSKGSWRAGVSGPPS